MKETSLGKLQITVRLTNLLAYESEWKNLTHPFELEWNNQLYWHLSVWWFWFFCVYIHTYTSIYTHTGIYECVCVHIHIYSHSLYCSFFRDNFWQSSIFCSVGIFLSLYEFLGVLYILKSQLCSPPVTDL